jgi:hypothetical protein
MRIQINDSNRAEVAEMFERFTKAVKLQSSQHSCTAVEFSDTGLVVEVAGTMEDLLPPGSVPDGTIYWARDAILIDDGKLIHVGL